MEPITMAFAFSTIVGLVCNFRQEKKGRNDLSNKDFLDWLEEHNFKEIKEEISQNSELLSQLDNTLRYDFDVVNEKLDKIDRVISSLLLNVEEFSGIAKEINPESMLSEQATNVLREIVNSDSGTLNYKMYGGGPVLSSGRSDIAITEPKFIKDDLNTLVEFGCLDKNSEEKFTIKRKSSLILDLVNRR
jgi:hypothetical protein